MKNGGLVLLFAVNTDTCLGAGGRTKWRKGRLEAGGNGVGERRGKREHIGDQWT